MRNFFSSNQPQQAKQLAEVLQQAESQRELQARLEQQIGSMGQEISGLSKEVRVLSKDVQELTALLKMHIESSLSYKIGKAGDAISAGISKAGKAIDGAGKSAVRAYNYITQEAERTARTIWDSQLMQKPRQLMSAIAGFFTKVATFIKEKCGKALTPIAAALSEFAQEAKRSIPSLEEVKVRGSQAKRTIQAEVRAAATKIGSAITEYGRSESEYRDKAGNHQRRADELKNERKGSGRSGREV